MSEFNIQAAAQRISEEFGRINAGGTKADAPGGDGFGEILSNLLDETDQMQTKADVAVDELISGEKDNVQEVMVAMAKADVSFRMVLEVRNKLLDAYQEIMRMQV